MNQHAQGFIEATGYVAAIEVADAMAKAAEVKIVMAHKVDGPRVCVICEGDVAACKAAVDAGQALCESRGTLIAANVIPRPEQGADELYRLLDAMKARKAAKKAERQARNAALRGKAPAPAATVSDPAAFADEPESAKKSAKRAPKK